MRKVILAFLMAASMTWVALAQCEAHFGVPVTNAPYSAVRRVITTKPKADGTTSRSEATEQVARDGKGRTYKAGERRWTTNIGGKSVEKSETMVSISDPVANTETTWDTTSKVAKIVHLPPSNTPTSANKPEDDPFSFEAEGLSGTNLGTKTIEGISVQGTRYQTDESTHECWVSPELKTVVLQTDQYPDQSFTNRLENIRTEEPDVSSYMPPPGYSTSHVHLEQSVKTDRP
jgi:hypothetical protein